MYVNTHFRLDARPAIMAAADDSLALVVAAAAASSAMAKEPTGEYAAFKQCPRFTSGVELCL